MGSIVGKEQMQILEEKVNLLKAETELIYDGKHDLVEANYENGLSLLRKVFYNDKPFEKYISRTQTLVQFLRLCHTKMLKKLLL